MKKLILGFLGDRHGQGYCKLSGGPETPATEVNEERDPLPGRGGHGSAVAE